MYVVAVSSCTTCLFYSLQLVYVTATPSFAGFITTADELANQGVNFTWSDVRAKTVKIVAEYSDENGAPKQVSLGSGFLISSDGLFVTAYHVMKFYLAEKKRDSSALATVVDCSNPKNLIRYRAYNSEDQFGIEIVSYLSETESTSGKDRHTPDEIIKHRDFITAQLRGTSNQPFVLAATRLRRIDDRLERLPCRFSAGTSLGIRR